MNRRNAPNLVVNEQLRDPAKIDTSNSTFVLAVSSQLTKRRIAFEQWLDHEDRSAFDVFTTIETYKDVLAAERATLEAHDTALHDKIENMSVGQTSIGQLRAELALQFSGDVVLDEVRNSVTALDEALESNDTVIGKLNEERKNSALLISLLRQHGVWIDKKLNEKATKFNHDPNVEMIEVDTAPLPFPTLDDDQTREPLILKTVEPLPPIYPPVRNPEAVAAPKPEIKSTVQPVDRDVLIQQALRALKLKARPASDIDALAESVYFDPIKQTAKLINERLAAGQNDEDTLILIEHRRRLMKLAKEAREKADLEMKFSPATLKKELADIEVDAMLATNEELTSRVIPRINQMRGTILAELERRQNGKEPTNHLFEMHWNLRSLTIQLNDFVNKSNPGPLNLGYVVENTAVKTATAQAPKLEEFHNVSTADAIELMMGEPLEQDERDELTPFTERWTEEIVHSAQHLVGNRTDVGMLEAIRNISLIEPRDEIRKEIVRQRREGIPLDSYKHLLLADKELTSCIKKADARLQERVSPVNVAAEVPAENSKAGWLSRASKWASSLVDRTRAAVGQLVETLTPRPQAAFAASAILATAIAMGSLTTGFNAKSGAIAETTKAPESAVAIAKIKPATEAFTKTGFTTADPDTQIMHGDYTLAEAKRIIAEIPAPILSKVAELPAAKKVFQEKVHHSAKAAPKAEPQTDTTAATKEQSYNNACTYVYGTEGEDRVNQCLNLAMK